MRADRAVELPVVDGRAEGRPSVGHRLHGGAQARRADAVDGAAAGRDRRCCRPAGRRANVVTGFGPDAGGLRRRPARRQGVVHRQPRHRHPHHAHVRRSAQARHPRARRQEPQHRLRRRRSRRRGCGHVWWDLRQSGRGLLGWLTVFVERAVYDEVLAMRANAAAITLGSGLDAATTMGPLVSAEQRQR